MASDIANPGIVVGVDGSPDATAAMQWAVHEARMRNVPLTLVHAAVRLPAGSPSLEWSGESLPAEIVAQLDANARQVLTDAAKLVEDMTQDHRLGVNSELSAAGPVAALVDLSRSAAMVVVGRSGHGALERALLGSVSTGLVHHAHCPVAVIHSDYSPPTQGSILVGVDGSPASELATAIAFDEASWRGADLVALHAWTDAEVPDLPSREWAGTTRTSWTRLRSAAEETLAERLVGWRERYPDVTVHRVVVTNRPAQHLIEHSASAQLVVVGSHGRGGFAGMLLGSVGTAVVQAVRAPVIVARQG